MMCQLSVIIGFRDWGLERLQLALRAHAASRYSDGFEVLVSDYGSVDSKPIQQVAEASGARYVRTEVDGPWSRARALNAGLAAASGDFLVTTDSDLLFAPDVLSIVAERLHRDSAAAQLIQCRDLSDQFRHDTIETFDWALFEERSRFRPRWGMGGMIAFHRHALDRIGGYDERMVIYGAEDMDLAKRLRWAGNRLSWIDDSRARIYHVWHASSRRAADDTPDGQSAIELNREIYESDRTIVRLGRHLRNRPIATVAITTHNRSEYLQESISSALVQTVDNIEVLVVDDGSTDDTESKVRAISDSRVRYVRQDHAGVAAARNRAVAEAKSSYLVIHDDDDIMLPWRVEAHFDALVEGLHGTYGGWVDFRNDTGELIAYSGRAFSLGGVLYGSAILAHGTAMFDVRVLKRFRYNELLRAGSDYNLILRMAASGVKLGHTNRFHILRRRHGQNLTDVISAHQRESARRTTNIVRRRFSSDQERAHRKAARTEPLIACQGEPSLEEHVAMYLPDSLVRRVAFIRTTQQGRASVDALAQEHGAATATRLSYEGGENILPDGVCVWPATWSILAGLTQLALDYTLDVIDDDTDDDTSGGLEPALARAIFHTGLTTSEYASVFYADAARDGTDYFAVSADHRLLVDVGYRQYFVAWNPHRDLGEALDAISGTSDIVGVEGFATQFGEQADEALR